MVPRKQHRTMDTLWAQSEEVEATPAMEEVTAQEARGATRAEVVAPGVCPSATQAAQQAVEDTGMEANLVVDALAEGVRGAEA